MSAEFVSAEFSSSIWYIAVSVRVLHCTYGIRTVVDGGTVGVGGRGFFRASMTAVFTQCGAVVGARMRLVLQQCSWSGARTVQWRGALFHCSFIALQLGLVSFDPKPLSKLLGHI